MLSPWRRQFKPYRHLGQGSAVSCPPLGPPRITFTIPQNSLLGSHWLGITNTLVPFESQPPPPLSPDLRSPELPLWEGRLVIAR